MGEQSCAVCQNVEWSISQFDRVQYKASPIIDDNQAVLQTSYADCKVQFLDPGIIRIRFGSPSNVNYGMVNEEVLLGRYQTQVREENSGQWLVYSELLSILIDSKSGGLKFSKEGKCVVESPLDGSFTNPRRVPPSGVYRKGAQTFWMFSLGLQSGEPIYGLGEKWSSLNKRGQLICSNNRDAVGVNTEWSYKNCPFLWSPKGWGVLFHTPGRVHHAIGYPPYSHRSYVGIVEDNTLDLFMFLEQDGMKILQKYSILTGKTPEIPLWGLGIWISRAWYKDQASIMEAAYTLRKKHLPADVIVFDGRTWLDTRTRFAFEWDTSRYSEPKLVLNELHELQFRVCCWEYPLISIYHPWFRELAGKGCLLKDRDTGETLIFSWHRGPFSSKLPPLPNSGILDFTNPEAYRLWQDMHLHLFQLGVDVMKTDFGEQVPDRAVAFNGDSGARLHNVYPLLYNRCVYEATYQYGNPDNGAPMVFGRSGWISSQRYPTQWGGDPQADWVGLEASIRGGLSWGLSGGTCYCTDIGGFYSREYYLSPELFVRWTQAAIYASHMRFHGLGPTEPWIFGEEIEELVRKCMELRYQLLVYLEYCLQGAREYGLPVMRALPLIYPQDWMTQLFDLEFLFGSCLLVAPVTRADGKVTFYLPDVSTCWYNWWHDDTRLSGGHVHTLQYPLHLYPLFVKEGTVLFLGPVVENTRYFTKKEKDLNVRVAQIHVYGMPRELALDDILIANAKIELEILEERAILKGVPFSIPVILHGAITMNRMENSIIIEEIKD
eukprot:jgi/Galph1/885/GphlegSOOS_G5667.1